MTLKLPAAIAAYYDAEARNDFTALSEAFAADGVVTDEGRTITGRAAIAAWMADSKAKYGHRTEPGAMHEEDGAYVVSSRVSGAFPNSPVTLNQRFRLADDGAIRSLGIS
jgi:ketosteroid isomerase-like protein